MKGRRLLRQPTMLLDELARRGAYTRLRHRARRAEPGDRPAERAAELDVVFAFLGGSAIARRLSWAERRAEPPGLT
jgi:hypothetical protein